MKGSEKANEKLAGLYEAYKFYALKPQYGGSKRSDSFCAQARKEIMDEILKIENKEKP